MYGLRPIGYYDDLTSYWVKEAGSNLFWGDVSLYRNEFDELVSVAAFDGRFCSTSLSTTSPEFGIDGYFAKYWIREADEIYLYKSGSDTFEIEPLSEYLTSQLARDFVRNLLYTICITIMDY